MTSLARRSSSQYAFPFFWVQTVFSLILSNRVRWSCAAVGFSSLCHYVYMSGSKHLDCLDLERRPRPSFLFCFFDAVVSFSSTKQVIWEQNPPQTAALPGWKHSGWIPNVHPLDFQTAPWWSSDVRTVTCSLSRMSSLQGCETAGI